jgi:hypothetical protein
MTALIYHFMIITELAGKRLIVLPTPIIAATLPESTFQWTVVTLCRRS